MTDLPRLRAELQSDPEGLGYAERPAADVAARINARMFAVTRLRSRAEMLALGEVTAADVDAALAVPAPVPAPVPSPAPPPPPAPVPEPPPPASVGPAVASMVVIGSGAPAGTVLTEYAQTFPRGAVPAGSGLVVRNGATALPTQMDVRTKWPDGSARHAQVAVALPALAARETLSLTQHVGPAGATPPASAADVRVTLDRAGQVWTLSAKDTVTPDVWRAGPLVTQRRYVASVPVEACGSAGLRLVLDVTQASDGSVTADVALRNDACLSAGTAPASYSVRVDIAGTNRLTATVTQGIFTAFVRQVRVGPAMPTVLPDIAHLAPLGVVPRLDRSLGLPADYLTSIRARMAAPAWAAPMASRDVTIYMPSTGGRPDIGPVPGWVAAWLVSGDPDALAHAHGNSEALAACPWHHWDAVNREWLTNDKRPGLWTDDRDAAWTPRHVGGDGKWTPETAHTPDAHAALYALTGRRSVLDGLLAQASWCVMAASAGYVRRHGSGEPGAGVLLVQTQQTRACAWSLRTVAHAAALAPDADPIKAYFGRAMQANLAYLKDAAAGAPKEGPAPYVIVSGWDAALGETKGYVPAFTNGDSSTIPPWQHDFLGATIAQIALMDQWPDARTVAQWLAQWSSERFLRSDMSPLLGCAYNLPVLHESTGARLKTWAAMQAAAVRRGIVPANWAAHNGNDYPATALNALAMLLNVFPADVRLRIAWNFLREQNTASLQPAERQKALQFTALPPA